MTWEEKGWARRGGAKQGKGKGNTKTRKKKKCRDYKKAARVSGQRPAKRAATAKQPASGGQRPHPTPSESDPSSQSINYGRGFFCK
jgi:hypothetical protein